ncbi:MAG: hypothetical protein C0424_09630 [Sphingobacteriaceae bacterium]|nr:hypothetical protein [Sphingobacteriaceae bacterium]
MSRFRFHLLFALLLCTGTALAQQSPYRFGLHFTPNYNWVSAETRLLNPEGGAFGFGYGLLIERAIGSTNYFFSTGLSVNQLQYKSSIDQAYYKLPNTTNTDVVATNALYQYRVQYFDLPLTMKMRTNQMGAVRIYGQFGLNTGIMFQAKARVENVPAVFDKEEFFFVNRVEDYHPNTMSNFVDDRVNIFRASILIGAGVEYLLSGDTHMIIGLRLDNPFTDAYRGEKLNGRTNSAGLQLGIIF